MWVGLSDLAPHIRGIAKGGLGLNHPQSEAWPPWAPHGKLLCARVYFYIWSYHFESRSAPLSPPCCPLILKCLAKPPPPPRILPKIILVPPRLELQYNTWRLIDAWLHTCMGWLVIHGLATLWATKQWFGYLFASGQSWGCVTFRNCWISVYEMDVYTPQVNLTTWNGYGMSGPWDYTIAILE